MQDDQDSVWCDCMYSKEKDEEKGTKHWAFGDTMQNCGSLGFAVVYENVVESFWNVGIEAGMLTTIMSSAGSLFRKMFLDACEWLDPYCTW